MTLTNTRTVETLRVQFNPERLSEKIEAVFTELEILGNSHQLLQFKHAKNIIVGFDLRFDALVQREWNAAKLLDARKFIFSLAQPSRGDKVGTVDPPEVIFTWPKLYSITARIHTPSFEHTRFARSGAPTLSVCRIDLKEVLDIRRTSEDMRQDGTSPG